MGGIGDQRWECKRTFFVEESRRFRPSEYELAAVEEDAPVKRFVETHHYAGTYPAARRRWGLFRRGELVGAFVFAHPSNDRALTMWFPGAATDSLELSRMVLLPGVGFNAESWALARIFAQLRQENVREGEARGGFRGILSFSDPFPRDTVEGRWVLPGHVGTTYQASNALFAGIGTSRTLLLLPDATTLNARSLQKVRALERGWESVVRQLVRYGAAPLLLASDTLHTAEARREAKAWVDTWVPRLTRPRRHPGNYRYLWALDGEARAHLLSRLRERRLEGLSYPTRTTTNLLLSRYGAQLQPRAA